MEGEPGAQGRRGPEGGARWRRWLAHPVFRAVGRAGQRAGAAVVEAIPLPYRPIVRFFLPLAVTYTVMMFTHLIMNAGLARTATPAVSIAAFSVGLSVVGFFESPAIVMRPASISMARGEREFRVLSGVAYITLAAVTTIMALIAFTPGGPFLFRRMFDVPESLLQPVMAVFRLGLAVPVLSGLRQLYQGVIIYRRETGVLTVAIFSRLLVMWVVITLLLRTGWASGAMVGMWTFIAGVGCEMAVAIWWVRKRRRAWRKHDWARERGRRAQAAAASRPGPSAGAAAEETAAASADAPPAAAPPQPGLQAAEVLRFVLPFLVATVVETLYRPSVNAGLGRTAGSEANLAAFAVAWTMAHLVINTVKNLHQVVMVFGHTPDGLQLSRRFAFAGGVLGAALIVLASVTPAGKWFVLRVLGVGEDLAALVTPALLVFALQALCMGVEQGMTGLLLLEKRTAAVTLGRAINLAAVVAGTGFLLARWPGLGAKAGAWALVVGTAAETVYLGVRRWAVDGRRGGALGRRR